MALPLELWSHIYSFAEKPANTAPVSREHRVATYKALYNRFFELSLGSVLCKIGEDLGKWRSHDSEGSIQRWLAAQEKIITYIQIRQPRLADEAWKEIALDPFNPVHWQLQDIKRAIDAIHKDREDRFVTFFEGEIQAELFRPPLNLPAYMSTQEKIEMINNWLETKGAHIAFGRLDISDFEFPPSKFASLVDLNLLIEFFSDACYQGDYEFLQAILTNPTHLEAITSTGRLVRLFSDLCEKYPLIGKEILDHNPHLQAHLAPALSVIIDIAASEGHLSTLNAFNSPELNKGAILEKACYAGQSQLVKELLKNHHFSRNQLGWSLFVSVEGPAIVTGLLPIPFIYSLFNRPVSYMIAYVASIGGPLIIYRQFFPSELRLAAPNRETILSPTEKSLLLPAKACLFLCIASMAFGPGIALIMSAFEDDQISVRFQPFRIVGGLTLLSVFPTVMAIPVVNLLRFESPKRSFSFLSGCYSSMRDTAVGRLKVIKQLGSAILKRIPCIQARRKRNEDLEFKEV